MPGPSRFNVEAAVAAWRRSLETRRVILDEDLDELTQHLRDHMDHLIRRGLAPEDAFRRARAQMGTLGATEAAYRRVYWGKLKRKKARLRHLLTDLTMLKNYLKITLRTLRRHAGYTVINVTGLAVGIACCLLILLYVQDEWTYDRFHTQADRVFRVAMEHRAQDAAPRSFAAVPYRLAPILGEELSGVERLARLAQSSFLVRNGERKDMEERFFFGDSTVFDLFTVRFLQGDPATALDAPFSVVLTAPTARKYFDDENPIGRTLTVRDDLSFTVTGVVEAWPEQSHAHFDLLASLSSTRAWYSDEMFESWGAIWTYTYLLLDRRAGASQMETQMNAAIGRHIPPDAPVSVRLFLQPLPDIHLHSQLDGEIEPNGNIAYLYLFSVIAAFILLIACINFMNLATARATNRAREVGVRKVLGAFRGQVTRQFLMESFLLSGIAVVLALLLAWLALPLLNAVAGKSLSLTGAPALLLAGGLLGIGLLVGIVSGSYPALYLSRFAPAHVLKGDQAGRGSRGARWLRRGLVVFQFAISIVLIVGTLVVSGQLQYVRTTNLGFDREHVLTIRLNNREAREQAETLKQTMAAEPGVVRVSVASNAPPDGLNSWRLRPVGAPDDATQLVPVIAVDFDYLETLGITIADGRGFDETFPSDVEDGLLLNGPAARLFGLDDPIGQRFEMTTGDRQGTVIGVVEDFHLTSLHDEIRPVALLMNPGWNGRLLVKLRPERVAETVAALEDHWSSVVTDWPFEFAFLDDRFDALYQAEQQMARLFGYFAGLAVFIACLGLFGLAAFTAEQRTKEIGIRKALGASVPQVVLLLARQFAVLVVVGFVVGAPVAYVAMSRWLDGFAYRIDISWRIFLLAGLAALVVALVTVSYQSIKAALVDPVLRRLRYE